MGRPSPRRPLAAALLATALTAAPFLSLAQTAPPTTIALPTAVDAQGATALAASLEAGLKSLIPHTQSGSGPRWTGVVTAAPDGDAYQVALPALSLMADDGSRLDIGVITLRVRPQPDGTQAFTAALPASMPAFDAKNVGDGALTIASQTVSGAWSPAYETLVALDMNLGTLAAVNGKGQAVMKLGTVAARLDLKPEGASPIHSGPGSINLNNLLIQDETGTPVATVGTFGTDFTYSRVDLDKLRKLSQATHPAAATPALTPADLRGLFGGMGMTLRMGDSSFFDPKDKTRFGFRTFAVTSGVEGLDTPSTSVRFGYDHEGMSFSPPPGPPEFMPDSAGLAIAAVKLPTDAFAQAFSLLAGSSEEGAGPLATGVLLGALGQAGSEIRLEKLTINTPATAGSASGGATFNAGAAFGAIGTVTVSLKGLDNTIKAMQPAPGKKPTEDDQKTLGALTMIQAMGQASKDAQGNDVRLYAITLTPTGQIMLNGADMSALLGLGADGEGEDGDEEEEVPAPMAPGKKKL